MKLALALLLVVGCGSVTTRAGTADAGAELAPDDAPESLDAPASGDLSAENPPEAGPVEGGVREPSCTALRPAQGAPCLVQSCSATCHRCRWCGTSENATGCTDGDGALCVADCSDCP